MASPTISKNNSPRQEDDQHKNGSLGTIIASSNNVTIVDFEGTIISLNLYQASFLDHAYALTAHKAQGSQWPPVTYINAPTAGDQTRLKYTASTRSQNLLLLLCAFVNKITTSSF